MISFNFYQFSDLNTTQLYDLLKMRSEIFVVEQNCVYLDIDGKDKEAIHLIGTVNSEVVAYLRIFPPTESNDYIVFGRVTTKYKYRRYGYGKSLMKKFMEYCEEYFSGVTIKCSAQYYLVNFYESFGLRTIGEMYLEDDLPHIAMIKEF